MKISIEILFMFLGIVLFTACEQEVVDSSGLKYKEQLVVKAFIFSGCSATGIKITRTLPPLENYDYYKALVKDAYVNIIHDNQNYKLNFNTITNSYENENLIFQEGETYLLEVNWKNLRASSVTVVPKFEVTGGGYYAKELIDTTGKYQKTYWAGYINTIIHSSGKYTYYFDELDTNSSFYYFYYDNLIGDNEKIINNSNHNFINLNYFISSALDSKDSTSAVMRAKIKCDLIVFDHALWNYKMSYWAGSNDNFGVNTNADWNISGDGLGLFIGANRKEIKFD